MKIFSAKSCIDIFSYLCNIPGCIVVAFVIMIIRGKACNFLQIWLYYDSYNSLMQSHSQYCLKVKPNISTSLPRLLAHCNTRNRAHEGKTSAQVVYMQVSYTLQKYTLQKINIHKNKIMMWYD